MEVEKVQNIAIKYNQNNNGDDKIPWEFIRPENEQPATTTAHGVELQVPTIDLGDPDEERLVELITKASQEWGLFQVVNHGIPSRVIHRLQAAGKHFFELPQQEKEQYAQPPGYHGDEGYGNKLTSVTTSSSTITTDAAAAAAAAPAPAPTARAWVDHLFHTIWPPSIINYQFWPKNPPSYREANEEYAQCLRGVAEKLMKCWSKGLGLSEEKVREAAGGEEMVYLAKINYYPPCPWPEVALGVPAHTDLSLLTILVPNDVPGLQVSRDAFWYNVRYVPNALVIHIGDQLEVLSNGQYKAVLHRTTVNKEKTRMSWPVFIEPPPHHQVGPIPDLITDHNPPKYKTKKYVDYKYCKLNKLPQ